MVFVLWVCVAVGLVAVAVGFLRGFLNDSDTSSEGVWFRTILQGMCFLGGGVFGLFLLGSQNFLFLGLILFAVGALAILISVGESRVQNAMRIFGTLTAFCGILVVIHSIQFL